MYDQHHKPQYNSPFSPSLFLLPLHTHQRRGRVIIVIPLQSTKAWILVESTTRTPRWTPSSSKPFKTLATVSPVSLFFHFFTLCLQFYDLGLFLTFLHYLYFIRSVIIILPLSFPITLSISSQIFNLDAIFNYLELS